jgi:hypothetical protein
METMSRSGKCMFRFSYLAKPAPLMRPRIPVFVLAPICEANGHILSCRAVSEQAEVEGPAVAHGIVAGEDALARYAGWCRLEESEFIEDGATRGGGCACEEVPEGDCVGSTCISHD